MSGTSWGDSAEPASPGHAIAARRKLLGLTAEDIVSRAEGEISLKLLSELENNHRDPTSLRLGKYKALLDALQWSTDEFAQATGAPALPTRPAPASDGATPESRGPRRSLPVNLALVPDLAARASRLVTRDVDEALLVSDRALGRVHLGGQIVVELGATAQPGDLVLAALGRDATVLMEPGESVGTVFQSLSPSGPLLRLGDEPPTIQGVVRVILTNLL